MLKNIPSNPKVISNTIMNFLFLVSKLAPNGSIKNGMINSQYHAALVMNPAQIPRIFAKSTK